MFPSDDCLKRHPLSGGALRAHGSGPVAVPRLSSWASVRLPWSRLQPPPLKFRTAGFPRYGFKLQAPRSSAESLPGWTNGLSLIPTFATATNRWLSPSELLRPKRFPPRCAGPRRRTTPPGPRGPRSGELVMVSPSSLIDLIRQSGFLLVHFPAELVIGTVFDIQGSSCLETRPSELSLLGFPGLPPSTSAGRSDAGTAPFFRIGTGHRIEGRKSWHLRLLRLNQLRAGTQFRRLVRSLSLRPSWLLALGADPTEVVLSPLGRLGLLLPGFQSSGHPGDCRI